MSAVPKPQAPRLVPMLLADIDRIMPIEREIYDFPWTPGNFSDSIRADYQCWLYQEGDSIAGYAIVLVGAGEAHLLNLSVARTAQGRGVGYRLLFDVMAAALAHGAERMLLEVRPSNTPGRALYAKAGFTQVGLRKAYYPAKGGREDALVLARRLAGDGT